MEAQLRAETTRIEPELARKLKLEQMEVKKQLDMAKARLKACQVAEEIENEKDPRRRRSLARFPYSDNPGIPTSTAGAQAFKIGLNRIKGNTAHSAASRRAKVS